MSPTPSPIPPASHRPLAPPRAAEALVRRAIADERWRDVTLGDLGEEFAGRVAATGPARARAWYWRQAGSLTVQALVDAVRAPFRPAGGPLMSTLIRETRLAIRALRRQPLLTALVMATLALGLGANAATFGMIDALALRPFTFSGIDRLAVLAENSPDVPYQQSTISPANFLDLRERSGGTFTRLAAIDWWDVNISGGDEPELVQGQLVSPGFFDILGVQPQLGRAFVERDEVYGEHRRVVLSDSLWRRRFGADPALVGRSIRLDGLPYDVVGIAPAGFDFPNGTQAWAPLSFDAGERANRSSHYLTVIARLRDGVTLDDAQAAATGAYAQLKRDHPDETRDRALVVYSFTRGMTDYGLPRILSLWQAAALLVLVIGCVNVANLLLARGAERQREIAVRLAIGAGRGQLLRQLLIESVVVAVVSVPAALGVAWVVFRMVRTQMPAAIERFLPGWAEMGVDARVVGATFVAAVGAAFVFGLLPALQVSRPALTRTLRDGGRSASAGVGRNRLRRALVVCQVALVLPLLVMSGLAAIGAYRFANGDQGYDPDGVVRMKARLPEATYPDTAARRRFVSRLLEETARLGSSAQVATTSVTPSSQSNQRRDLVVDGQVVPEDALPRVNYRAVSGGYLELMRIPITQGRGIEASDRAETAPVAVVSASMARRHWPDRSPIGARIKFGRDATDWYTVVGVAGDTIDDWFQYRREPTVYVPVLQAPSAQVYLMARAAGGDGTSLLPDLRRAVAAVDPDQAVFEVSTMRNAIYERTTGIRFIGSLMAGFGVVALVLAAFGIYGVMAHYVVQRRQEIGVRMALGATRGDVLRLTLGQSAKLAAIGIAIGLALGVALARVMENVLFGVVALEPSLFVGITAGLTGIAFLASLVPARHAARTSPMQALRD
ncbi:MAG: ADOP family duplicated permease [Vicinamibacterales bacterium]